MSIDIRIEEPVVTIRKPIPGEWAHSGMTAELSVKAWRGSDRFESRRMFPVSELGTEHYDNVVRGMHYDVVIGLLNKSGFRNVKLGRT